MTSPYIEDAAERARNSRAPAEVIDFTTREQVPTASRSKLSALWAESLEIETLARLTKDSTAFTQKLCASITDEGSRRRLAQWHKHMIVLQNDILKAIIEAQGQ